ncbi:helix-turn-helix transcriptional regulator [Shewanella algae]|uniref:XRE family transcriptional regulator n=1 Tax=Shewanella algae TaxID=38313 RepID=UPI00300519D7
MNPLSKNIVQRMRELGLTQKQLAERSGVSQPMVHKLVSGKATATARLLDLARALECSPERLMYGEEGTENLPASNASFADGFDAWDETTPLEKDEIEVPFYTEVELAAGSGSIAARERTGKKIRFSKTTLRRQGVDPLHAVGVKVTGNSMEPVLPNGCSVGVDLGNTKIVDGKMYAINHDGMLRVKLLYRLPGNGLRFRSYNQDEYPDEIYSEDKASNIKIIGKIFWYSVLL